MINQFSQKSCFFVILLLLTCFFMHASNSRLLISLTAHDDLHHMLSRDKVWFLLDMVTVRGSSFTTQNRRF